MKIENSIFMIRNNLEVKFIESQKKELVSFMNEFEEHRRMR